MDTNVANFLTHPVRKDTRRGKSYSSLKAQGKLLDHVYSVRYRSYIADDYIEPNNTRRFFDEFDHQENAQSFLTYCNDELVGSIRSCVFTPKLDMDVPVMEIFDKELRSEVGYENPFVESNKFVIAPEYQRRGGIRARFNMFRNIVNSAKESGANTIVTAVRPEHINFYKMFFFSLISETKSYPHLKFKTVLLACYNVDALKEFIWSKTK